MDCDYLSGIEGDNINVVLATCDYKLKAPANYSLASFQRTGPVQISCDAVFKAWFGH